MFNKHKIDVKVRELEGSQKCFLHEYTHRQSGLGVVLQVTHSHETLDSGALRDVSG